MAGLLREHSREYKDINSLYFVFPDKKMAVTSEEFPVNKQGISGEHIEELEKIQELDSFPVLVESPIHEGGSFLSVIQKVEDDNGEILGLSQTSGNGQFITNIWKLSMMKRSPE